MENTSTSTSTQILNSSSTSIQAQIQTQTSNTLALMDNDKISKWATLQMLLKDEVSLTTSVNLRHEQTIAQFSTKCYKIYKKKIKVKDLTEFNRKIIEKIGKKHEFNPSIIKILGIQQNLSKAEEIEQFLIEFRKNNSLMLDLIDSLSRDESNVIAPFLCHFFYENFYSESTEQIEMLYIIYLLLEKEIDKLNTPSIGSFLDDSFISKFLIEFANRYEVKCYLNKILKDLIITLENNYNDYLELDLDEWKKKEAIEAKQFNVNVHLNSAFMRQTSKTIYKKPIDTPTPTTGLTLNANPMSSSAMTDYDLKSSKTESGLAHPGMKKSPMPTPDSFFPNSEEKEEIEAELKKSYNETEMKALYEKADSIKKSYLLSQLKKLGNQSDLFSNREFNSLLFSLSSRNDFLIEYQKTFKMITNFLSKLLENIKEDISIMPYSIKCICKMIRVLIKNKFKSLSNVDTDAFVCEFLFGKLMLPILLNPDINDFGASTVISMTTRKNLLNIAKILKHFMRGRLFTSTSEANFTVFNSFIINNISQIDFLIQKISHVSLPNKLEKLARSYYDNRDPDNPFILNNSKRNQDDINYDYFDENKYDFMEHQSICFNFHQLKILFETVRKAKLEKEKIEKEKSDNKSDKKKAEKTEKDRVEKAALLKVYTEHFEHNEPLMAIYTQIDEFWKEIEKQMMPLKEEMLENQRVYKFEQRQYYIIIKDSYKEDEKKLLFTKEKPISLGAAGTDSEYTKEMKYCISYLLSQMEMQNNCDWVSENLDTPKTFNLIHQFNEYYDEITNTTKVPLSWYSLYVITNLGKMAKKYQENDYELLYKELLQEANRKIDLLKRINDFLTIQITSKFSCLDHNIHIANKELSLIRATKLNIELEKFIETSVISMCITQTSEVLQYQKANTINATDQEDSKTELELVVGQANFCIHQQPRDDKKKDAILEKQNHCNTINEFIHLFSTFPSIKDDLVNNTNFSKAKEGLDIFIQIIQDIITPKEMQDPKVKNRIRDPKDTKEYEFKNPVLIKRKGNMKHQMIESKKQMINKALIELTNYILKKSFVNLYPENPIKEDIDFYTSCRKIQWIDPIKNMTIPPAVHNTLLFDKLKEYIIKLESEKTPSDKLKALSKEAYLITSLIQFTTNNKIVQADELLPIIIYSIIIAKPKRMVSSHRWIKMFMNENTTLGGLGYISTHLECGIQFVTNVNHMMLKVSEEEFNQNSIKCLKETT